MTTTLKINLLTGDPSLMPSYGSAQAAGLDLRAAAPCSIAPHQRQTINTGVAMAIPVGFEGQVRPRSGLAAKHGVTVLNAPGTIDSDYRGEVKVVLINHGAEAFFVEKGMRIAQLVVAPVVQVGLEIVETLEATDRGAGGFGSTGI